MSAHEQPTEPGWYWVEIDGERFVVRVYAGPIFIDPTDYSMSWMGVSDSRIVAWGPRVPDWSKGA